MKKILILGAGTAGTIMANKLRRSLERKEWDITIIDQNNDHYYQPGFLFVPFGINTAKELRKSKRDFLPPGVDFVISELTNVDWDKQEVSTKTAGKFQYDILIMATGAQIRPEEIEGMMEGWGKNIHTIYTYEGCQALQKALNNFEGGKLVFNVAELPYKCPVAPIEFVCLADWWLQQQGIRDKVDISLVTVLTGAFTKPTATEVLTEALTQKNISVVPNYLLGSVDAERKVLQAFDGTEIDYDLLVSIPPTMGAQVMADSGVGDATGYIVADRHTLQPPGRDNVWALGDGGGYGATKAGSTAHYQSEVVYENVMAYIHGERQLARSDGHTFCYIESGFNKGWCIDYTYEIEPVMGDYPFPGVPLVALLKDTEMNHIGKMMFKWIYWHLLLKGVWLGPHTMQQEGKDLMMSPWYRKALAKQKEQEKAEKAAMAGG